MNRNDKILVSLTAGIAIGAILGILLTRDSDGECEQDIKDILQYVGKNHSKPGSLKEDIEEAVKEAFAENPEEYA